MYRLASNGRKEGQLGNPTYGKQEVNDQTSRGRLSTSTTLGNGHSYSSIGPEYEPVEQVAGQSQSNEEMHISTNLTASVMFQPAPYEVPVNIGTLTTLN